MSNITWEEAVARLRSDPNNKQTVLENYFEADLTGSCERFLNSEEFKATINQLTVKSGKLLDIGAGRGIASYAFAKSGYNVTALEPDPSNDVGAGAIRKIAKDSNLTIEVTESFGEKLPYEDASFDVVYARQVLHHAADLAQFCKEVFRVLKPGGCFIAVREHVLSKQEDLDAFLASHTLHYLYGGENAFTLPFYLSCMNGAGFEIKSIIHSYASVMNYAPVTEATMKQNFAKKISRFSSSILADFLINIPAVYRQLADLKASKDNTPGRLYSFVCNKPLSSSK